MNKIVGLGLIAGLALAGCGTKPKASAPGPSDSDLCHRPDSMLVGYVLTDNPHATYANPVLRADVTELERTLKAQSGWEAPYERVRQDCHTLYPLPRITFFDVTPTAAGTP